MLLDQISVQLNPFQVWRGGLSQLSLFQGAFLNGNDMNSHIVEKVPIIFKQTKHRKLQILKYRNSHTQEAPIAFYIFA